MFIISYLQPIKYLTWTQALFLKVFPQMLILSFEDYKKQFKLPVHTSDPEQSYFFDKTLQKISSHTFTRGRMGPKSTSVYHNWAPKLLRILKKSL